jgi:transcriptional regulator with GAF, ATPase, and Fis domain
MEEEPKQLTEDQNPEWKARDCFVGIIGKSRAIRRVIGQDGKCVAARGPVLICGETGTGKEQVAKGIHESGPRGDRPLVIVNCGAIPAGLVEAELFGVEQGAATGVTARAGKFEQADKSTIFLDEIGDLPLDAQVKLLRAIEIREITRVGGATPKKLDVRVIAATNRDLRQMVAQGTFRDDLYQRVAEAVIVVPPLRERTEDIPLMIEDFVPRFARENARPVPLLSEEAARVLREYDYPGNVRELMTILERAVMEAENDQIDLACIREAINPYPDGGVDSQSVTTNSEPGRPTPGFRLTCRQLIEESLTTHHEQRFATARALGFSIVELWFKSLLYGVRPRNKRTRAPTIPELRDWCKTRDSAMMRALIVSTLQAEHGDVARTAKQLNVSPSQLYELIKQHGLNARDCQ